MATATSPGNGTNATTCGYTNKQLTSITPVTGTSLGNRALRPVLDSGGAVAAPSREQGTHVATVHTRALSEPQRRSSAVSTRGQ